MSREHDNSKSDADESLPDVGEDLAPTNEMIVQGKIGNGTYDRFTPELAKQIQVERTENKRLVERTRRESYEEGQRDMLKQVEGLQGGILGLGAKILQRLENGDVLPEELTPTELGTLKLAHQAGLEVRNAAIGKPKTVAEVSTQTNILHLIAGIDNG
jgi:hypothetical protein